MARPTRRTVIAPKRRIAAALRGAASPPDAPSAPVPLRLVRRSRAALLRATALQGCAALVLALPAAAQPAPNARPTGGQVVAGSASIQQGSAQTTITQSSQRAAVEWKSFDVGPQHTVRFQQPSAGAVTLNRVTGPDPSHIAGRIQANGQVVLTNQSGVTFARGAQVDTAGLIVSAAGISNRNFMAGKMVFDQPAKRDAAIVNEGTITVRQAGLAALVAPQVANTGTITARLGHVVLAGARAATLDLYGDGLVSLDVTRQVTETPRGPDGKPVTALVTNDGVVRAQGGTVQLSASAVDGVVTNLVTAGGTISAATHHGRTGTIAIGGLGGNVTVTGTLAADGRRTATAANARGGAVEVTASGTVTLAAGARVSASGSAGGGAVAIGTTLARARSLTPTGVRAANASPPAASATIVEAGARIAADAGTNGAGGRVAILSAGRTRMDGAITARGGPQGGDGGLVEVSGHALGLTGSIDTGAPAGRPGTILLDPDLLLVVDGSSGSGDFDASFLAQSGTIFATQPDRGFDTISNGVINGFTGNVLLQANQALAVLADIDLTRGAHQNLTLESGGLLSIGPWVKVTASGDVVLASGGVGPGTPPPAWVGNAITVFGTIASTGGSVSLLTGPQGTIAVDAAARISAAQGQRLTLQGDTITLAGRLAAPGGIVEIAPTSALPIDLGGTTGLSLSPATLAAIEARVLRLGAVTVDGTLATTATGIRVDAPLTLAGAGPEITPSLATPTLGAETLAAGSAGTLDLHTTGSVVVAAGGGLSVGLLTGAVGALDAGQGSNRIAGIGSLAVDGLLSLANAGGITLSGPITTGGALTLSDTGAIILAGSVSAGGAASLRSDAEIEIDGRLAAQGDVSLVAAESLTISGTVIAGPTLIATAGTEGIVLDAGALLQAGLVDLWGGSVQEDAAAAITATHLRSSGGIGGEADLGGRNAIGTLDGFAAAGRFVLEDQALDGTLVLAGPLTAASILLDGGTAAIRTVGTARADADLVLRGAALVLDGAAEIAAPSVTLAAGPGGISIGSGARLGQDGATLSLGTTGGGITEAAGATIRADLLQAAEGGLTGDVVLRGTGNAIARLGTLPVDGAFLLRNTGTLAVAGTLSATGVDLDTTGLLAVSGSILPTSGSIDIALAGATIDLLGLVRDGGGSVALTARAGNVWEVGTLEAGLLTGSAAGRVAFLGENRIVTLGSFTAAEDLRLFSRGTVTVAGAVEVGVGQTLGLRSDGLAIGGTLIAPDGVIAIAPLTTGGTIGIDDQRQAGRLSLTQGDFDRLHAGTVTLGALGGTIAGAIAVVGSAALDAANAPVLHLAATGAVSGAGSLGAATLTGTADSVALTGPNRIATLGSFTATGGFALANATDLTIAGPVTAGGTLAVTGSAAVTQTGSLAAPEIALTASSLTLLAPITATGGVTLTATAGDIDAPAPIATAALGGSATGRATLGGANRIATLTGFSAGQGFTFADTVDLTVSGPVTGGPSVLLSQTGTLTLAGTIAAGDVALAADGLQLGGTILAPGALQLVTPNAVVQTGRLTAGSVTVTAGGAVQLVGDDTIAILGNVTAPGGLTLRNQGDLLANGQILGGPAADITTTGSLTVAGALSADTVALQGSSVTVQGAVAAPGTIGVTATAGDLLVNGTLTAGPGAGGPGGSGTLEAQASGSLRIVGTLAGGGIALTAGADIFSSGSIAGDGIAMQAGGGLLLGGTIGTGLLDLRAGGGVLLQDTIEAGSATLQAGGGAALTGRVSAGALAMTVGGDLGLGGTIAAGMLTAAAGGAIAIPGGIAARAATLAAGGSLSLTGALAADTLAVTAGGDLIASGSLTAGVLDGRAGGSVGLTGAIRIATIGSLVAGGAVTVLDGEGLTITGLLQAGGGLDLAAQGALVLAGTALAESGIVVAPSISIPGTLAVGQGLSLTATAGDLGGAGVVQAAVLTGEASGAVALTGPNQVPQIAALRAGSAITLANQPALTIAGPVDGGTSVAISNQGSVTIAAPVGAAQRVAIRSAAGGLTLRDTAIDAPQILLSTPASQSVLLSGGTIATAGTTPRGRIPASSPLLPSNGGQGALIATGTLRQTGVLTVQGASGGDPVLQLQAAGNVSLATVQAPDTWLVLSLQAGRATAADLTIARLDVIFDGVGGSANLVGAVGGITGAASAQQAYILPRSDPNYLLNGCAIGSVSCILVQREQVPAQRPLDTVDFAPLRQPGDDADLLQLLPNVSRRDY